MLLQLLQNKQEAPQLPASYPVMALLALMPSLFFLVMDARAEAAMQKPPPLTPRATNQT